MLCRPCDSREADDGDPQSREKRPGTSGWNLVFVIRQHPERLLQPFCHTPLAAASDLPSRQAYSLRPLRPTVSPIYLYLGSDRSPANRSDCSNIADNPVHETLPDKLIGTKTVVETRLAKYVAVSLLTRDLLDTSSVRNKSDCRFLRLCRTRT